MLRMVRVELLQEPEETGAREPLSGGLLHSFATPKCQLNTALGRLRTCYYQYEHCKGAEEQKKIKCVDYA